MPNSSYNFLAVENYISFVQKYGFDLIGRLFYTSAVMRRAILHDMIKGRLTLTQFNMSEFGRRWSKDFDPPVSKEFMPVHLDVEAGKFECFLCPQDYENSYLGLAKQSGFNNTDVIPFEGFVMQQETAQKNQEIADALWQGVKAATPAATDNLKMIFDGYFKKIDDAVAAGNLTVTPTPGGALTRANIIDVMEEMVLTINNAYRGQSIDVYVSPNTYLMYQQAYRDKYKIHTIETSMGVTSLDFINFNLVKDPGMGDSQKILMTPQNNMHIGFDDLDEVSMWNFEKEKRAICMWSDFKVGVQFGRLEDGIVAVNDLA